MRVFWQRARYGATLLFFVVLPWQTRFIYRLSPLGDDVEYGRLSFYASEIALGFLVLSALWYGVQKWRTGTWSFRPVTLNRAWIVGVIVVLLYGVVRSLFTGDVWNGIQHTTWILEATLVITLLMSGWMPWKAALQGFIAGSAIAAIVGIAEVIAQYIPANKWLGLSEHLPAHGGTSVVETGSTRFLRAYGPFPHPNIFGGYLVLGLVTLVTHARRGGLVVLLSAALALSFSRGAILAWVVTAGALFLFRRSTRFFLGVSLATIVVTLAVFWPFTLARFSNEARLEKRSIDERVTSVKDGIAAWKQAPWFGVGPAQFVNTFFVQPSDAPWWQWSPPHNVIVAALAEYGLVGVALLFITDGLFILYLLRATGDWRIIFWFIPVMVLVAFDHYLWSLYSGMMLFALFAGFCALSVHRHHTGDTQQAS